ncbi:MAG: hypothetical protein AVDCRST_MAG23-914, partial [uncultured Sphingosinicella sp.]
ARTRTPCWKDRSSCRHDAAHGALRSGVRNRPDGDRLCPHLVCLGL